MLSRFRLIPECYGRTDRQTDGQICYINIVHQHTALLTRDKNERYINTLSFTFVTVISSTVGKGAISVAFVRLSVRLFVRLSRT